MVIAGLTNVGHVKYRCAGVALALTSFCLAIPLCGCPVKQALSSCRDGRPFANNRHGPKSGGAAVPLSVGQLGPHLTQCGLGRGLPP